MFFNKNGEPTVSQFSTFMQDLHCPNPRGYSKSQIFIAAAIDLFFLPYDDISVTALRDISDVCGLIFLFFIVEEFISTNWVAVTVKRGVNQLRSFFPVYLGIVVACTVILKNRFGDYFMQFKSVAVGFLNLASWSLSTPTFFCSRFSLAAARASRESSSSSSSASWSAIAAAWDDDSEIATGPKTRV